MKVPFASVPLPPEPAFPWSPPPPDAPRASISYMPVVGTGQVCVDEMGWNVVMHEPPLQSTELPSASGGPSSGTDASASGMLLSCGGMLPSIPLSIEPSIPPVPPSPLGLPESVFPPEPLPDPLLEPPLEPPLAPLLDPLPEPPLEPPVEPLLDPPLPLPPLLEVSVDPPS